MFTNLRRAQRSRRLWEAARNDGTPERFYGDIWEALRAGQIRPQEFSVRNCFEQFVENGAEIVRTRFAPNAADWEAGINLLEAADAIDTSAFSNISGQIVYSTVLDKFNMPGLIWNRLVTTVQTEFNGEKIPGISGLGDEAETIGEGQPYPRAGVSEEFIETPVTTKRGFIVPVTREAVFFDRTGLILQRAGEVAVWMAVNKEKRVLDTVLGITTSYRRNGGAAQATYADSHTDGDFDNLLAGTPLVDWTDVESALLLFDAIRDPNTGEPVILTVRQVIVPSALTMTASMIFESTGIERETTSGGTTFRAQSNNPLKSPVVAGNFELISSQYVKDRTSSDSTWFVGDFPGAFQYRENWPVTVVQAADNSHDEFHRDIVTQYKASERGAPAVIEPRKVAKITG